MIEKVSGRGMSKRLWERVVRKERTGGSLYDCNDCKGTPTSPPPQRTFLVLILPSSVTRYRDRLQEFL